MEVGQPQQTPKLCDRKRTNNLVSDTVICHCLRREGGASCEAKSGYMFKYLKYYYFPSKNNIQDNILINVINTCFFVWKSGCFCFAKIIVAIYL